MQIFLLYILKLTLCSAVLFGYYWFMLRNKVFHGYNRFYLLAAVLLSLTVPLLNIHITHQPLAPKTSLIKLLQVVNEPGDYLEAVVVRPKAAFTFADTLPFLYTLISLVLLISLVNMLFNILSLARKNKNVLFNNVHFVLTPNAKGTPFSFFRYIFWNDRIDPESNSGKRIFLHELAHIRQKHSLDKMFINIVLIIFWINPFFWLIRKELGMFHEFTADQQAVENGDTAAFAAMILESAYPQQNISVTNPFFYSPLKRRLAMLTKNQHPKMNYLSRLMLLPLALLVFAAFALKTKNAAVADSNPITKLMGLIPGKSIESSSQQITSGAQSIPVTNKQIIVVIDAAHGGEDKGAVGVDGIQEKDLVLDLARKIKSLNTNPNVKIVLSRETDLYMDVKQKVAFADEKHADLFISVHADNTLKEKWDELSGMSIYISKDAVANNYESRIFASAVLGAFKNNYGISVPDHLGQRSTGIYVLDKAGFPAVLIEAGYLSNKKDVAFLTSPDGQKTFAANVLKAINDYSMQKDFVLNGAVALSDTFGYYKGRAVIAVKFINKSSQVRITYADKTTEVITAKQAEQARLIPPPPPPPPPPAPPVPPVAPAENDLPPAAPAPPKPPVKNDDALTEPASFPGGRDAFRDFLTKNLKAGFPWKTNGNRVPTL